MRTDYILYIVAVACFIIAGFSAATLTTVAMANALTAVVLVAIGAIFIWGGYSLRPSTAVLTHVEPVMAPTKPAMTEESTIMATPLSVPDPVAEPEPVVAAPPPEPEPVRESVEASIPETTAMPTPEPEKIQETSQPEPTSPAAKPVRKRRARKKT